MPSTSFIILFSSFYYLLSCCVAEKSLFRRLVRCTHHLKNKSLTLRAATILATPPRCRALRHFYISWSKATSTDKLPRDGTTYAAIWWKYNPLSQQEVLRTDFLIFQNFRLNGISVHVLNRILGYAEKWSDNTVIQQFAI